MLNNSPSVCKGDRFPQFPNFPGEGDSPYRRVGKRSFPNFEPSKNNEKPPYSNDYEGESDEEIGSIFHSRFPPSLIAQIPNQENFEGRSPESEPSSSPLPISVLVSCLVDARGSPVATISTGFSKGKSCQSVQERVQENESLKREEVRLKKRYNVNGNQVKFIPAFASSGQMKGAHSFVYTIASNASQCYPDIKNEDIVIKMPKHTNDIKFFYKNSLAQHDLLRSNLRVPVAEILNRDTCEKDGFILQRKVKPFEKAPWTENQTLEEIQSDPELNGYLEQIIEIFKYTLLDSDNPGIDIRWSNFGTSIDEDAQVEKHLVLFDFYEEDNPFYVFAKDALHLISGRNEIVFKYILDRIEPELKAVRKANSGLGLFKDLLP